ncbi:MAG: hypothetical protein ACRDSL_21030 [Pseudonocardiaceae bacterium]
MSTAPGNADPAKRSTAIFSNMSVTRQSVLGREGKEPIGDDRALGVLGFCCVAERLRFG